MNDIPTPAEFSEQLIFQLLADLDGTLSDGEQFAGDARALLQADPARAATLVLLTRAASDAYRQLLDEPRPIETIDVFAELFPALVEQAPSLFGQAERLAQGLAAAEADGERPDARFTGAIYSLYDGLREGDEEQGTRGLVTLRALLVHCDAAAQLIGDTVTRTLRPDRFHDHFLRLIEDISKREDGEAPVAALTRDGRLTAIVTDDVHPIEAGLRTLREQLGRDEAERDAAAQRMLALVDAIRRLGEGEGPPLGDISGDPLLYAALITAAATTPLAGEQFSLGALAQVARYNHSLMIPRGGAAPH